MRGASAARRTTGAPGARGRTRSHRGAGAGAPRARNRGSVGRRERRAPSRMDGRGSANVLRRIARGDHSDGLLLSGPRQRRRPAAATRMRRPLARASSCQVAAHRIDAADRRLCATPLPRAPAQATLAETTQAWREYAPRYTPLPHSSPRNQPWFKRHPWFEQDVLPALRGRMRSLLAA